MSFSLRALMMGAAAVIFLSLPAHATVFFTSLAGTNEVPPNMSAGSGTAFVTLDGNLLTVQVDFTGLSAPASAAHIHCCTPPGANRPVAVGFDSGFPNTTSGSYTHVFNLMDASIYTAAFRGGGTADAARINLVAALFAGTSYVNIHNSIFPGGEIRGQLREVPEPVTLGLLGLGLIGIAFRRRKAAHPA